MTASGVAVVGTGISGLTLALRLQQLGVDVTLYTERSAEDHRKGTLPNAVTRFEHTLARERALGVDHFSFEGYQVTCMHLSARTDPPVAFRGDSMHPIQAVDFRVLLPRFLEDFEARGGHVVVTGRAASVGDVSAWSERHEVVVVAVGRRSLAELFPRDPARSPYDRPQRLVCVGLYTGIALPEPLGVSYNISPGCGEIIQLPIWTRAGVVSSLLCEAVPGGPLEPLTRLSSEDPRGFTRTVEGLLADHAPRIAERIDTLALLGPDDLLQGALTPVVRQPWAVLPTGRIALAIGDAWITNDPITGQGANLGSHCAWVTADAIVAGGPYDETFARRLGAEMWKFAGPVTEWTNASLQPPPEHVLAFLAAATHNQKLADLFFTLFNDPVRLWAILSDPDRTQLLVDAHACADTP